MEPLCFFFGQQNTSRRVPFNGSPYIVTQPQGRVIACDTHTRYLSWSNGYILRTCVYDMLVHIGFFLTLLRPTYGTAVETQCAAVKTLFFEYEQCNASLFLLYDSRILVDADIFRMKYLFLEKYILSNEWAFFFVFFPTLFLRWLSPPWPSAGWKAGRKILCTRHGVRKHLYCPKNQNALLSVAMVTREQDPSPPPHPQLIV